MSAVDAALEIIDEEGLEAFSLPRLARHMGVSAPSLYHHFDDKSAILAAVSRHIVASAPQPRLPPPDQWQEWFVKMSLSLRASVLKHRHAAPLLLQFLPREETTQIYERAARYLDEVGIPRHLHVQILDGLESISLGATLTEAMRPPSAHRAIFPHVDRATAPALAAAIDANSKNAKQLFEDRIRSFLAGVFDLNEKRAAVSSPPR
jgi:TetR/AcrR family tetracycline transcriptional repressor